MAFTDLLSDPTNQIRVLPGASADTSLEASIKGVAGMAGSLVASLKEKSDEKLRDKIIGGLQSEFLTLTEAYKQGTMTEKEMNLRMDTRMRQTRADNPWIASDISKWVKEDLGLQPRGNTFVDERNSILKEEEMNNTLYGEAQKNGLIVKDPDGKINRQKSIDTMQDINRAILMSELAAKKKAGQGQRDKDEQALEVSIPLRRAYEKMFTPKIRNILDEVDEMAGTDVEKLNAAKQLLSRARQEFTGMILQPTFNNSTLSDEGIKGINGTFDMMFKQNEDLLFGDDYGAFKRNARNLTNAVDAGVVDLKTKTMGAQVLKGALGDKAMESPLMQAVVTSGATDGTADEIRAAMGFERKVGLVVDVHNKTKTVEELTPADTKFITKANAGMIDSLLPFQDLNSKDLKTLSNATFAYASAGTLKGNGENQIRALSYLNKPALFDKLSVAMTNSETANVARESLDKTLSLSKDFLIRKATSFTKDIDEELSTDHGMIGEVVFNPGAGKFELQMNEAVLRKHANTLGSTMNADREGVYRSLVGGMPTSKKAIEQLNNALNVASMSYRGMNKGADDIVVKQTLVDAAGYVTKAGSAPVRRDAKVVETITGALPEPIPNKPNNNLPAPAPAASTDGWTVRIKE